MGTVFFDITVSLDGFVAGPDPSLDDPLGKGGEELHDWAVATEAWRKSHGLEGGETNADSEVMAESIARQGAVVMGRRMFSGGGGPWEDDPNRDGWWGDDPPFRQPVFIVTHHGRDSVEFENGTTFTFVTDGIEAALDRAREAARDKDVIVAGGASVIQQALSAGAVDDFQLHVAPLVLGDGVRLFDELGSSLPRVEVTRVLHSPGATHLSYRVVE
jgi:dihydrofolate reductase